MPNRIYFSDFDPYDEIIRNRTKITLMERNQTELMTAVNQQHAWIQQLEQQIHVLEDRLSDLNDRIFD